MNATSKTGLRAAKPAVGTAILNVPNQLTVARLVLAIVLFALMANHRPLAGLIVFALAAATDWLDGFWARRYGQVTVLGRILDPFVDKVVVCGTFIFLAADPRSGVAAWMAVVIVGRELLVTALRSFLEQQGTDFSAAASGKVKMILQCIAASTSLYYLYMLDPKLPGSAPAWLWGLNTVAIWSAVAMTVLSGVSYVRSAVWLIRNPSA